VAPIVSQDETVTGSSQLTVGRAGSDLSAR
jgi:hypothetical protein